MIPARTTRRLSILALGLGACAPSAATPAPGPAIADTVLVVDTVTLEADSELDARVARLEIMLLERDARIVELQRDLDLTRQEVVRNLAKLQSQASRAEAASGLAEAELAVQTLQRAPGGSQLPAYGEAVARLEESSSEFAQENFGGALYLATQARALATAGRARLADRGSTDLRADEELFATPVPLRTVDQRANVRGGPGLGFGVIRTLDPRSPVVGQSYTNEWVRVSMPDGQEGWVFHTLITARGR